LRREEDARSAKSTYTCSFIPASEECEVYLFVMPLKGLVSRPDKITPETEAHNSRWSARFIVAAIVQGAIITGFTLFFVGAQVLISGINIIQFLSIF
jgi:hypothetical protein